VDRERIELMKTVRVVMTVALMIVLAAGARAQFKSQVEQESRISRGVLQESSPSLLFGWFNPEKFHMRHSVSFSYHTMGDQSVSLGTYTNSMMYEFADNLNARADVSLSYSPFNSFSGAFGQGTKNSLSSIYLSRAEVNYRPWENVIMQVQFRQIPYGMYSPYYSPWYREDGF
jgi:hypothetical protein